jgi:hypothetical protein
MFSAFKPVAATSQIGATVTPIYTRLIRPIGHTG